MLNLTFQDAQKRAREQRPPKTTKVKRRDKNLYQDHSGVNRLDDCSIHTRIIKWVVEVVMDERGRGGYLG